jgi:fructose/tagatose bisphosphate aldolase
MAFITLRQLLDHAAEHGYGVPAFNVNNMEQIHAIIQAAEATGSPVILQASAGARKRSEFDPRAALKAATAAASAICVERFEAFGCAGQAARIKPLPLDTMAHRYH